MASTPEIFRVLGIDLVAGETFDARHVAGGEPVAVLSRTLADQLFAGETAVGRAVAVQRSRWAGEDAWPVDTLRVIGVVEDTSGRTTSRRDRGALYLPFAQHYESRVALLARTASDPAAVAEQLRRIVQRVDPDLALLDVGTARAIVGADNLFMQVGAAGSGLLGGLALLLAMAGLYGVVADLVLRRTHEIGVRLALGADASRVMQMVFSDGLRPVLEGLAIATAALIIARFVDTPLLVMTLPAFEPAVLLIVPAVLISVAVLALYVPARRAARVDPNVALRHL